MTEPAAERTDVDGVATLHAPGRGTRYRAGLLFRVGRADETLATAGITHLVEHLALHQQDVGEFHYNGATADLYTHFLVEGSAEHVVEYFDSVCASLRNLPMHRLETEKEILRTEQSGRGDSLAGQLPLIRYGAQGYGLSSYREIGLAALSPERVRQWARTHFTRDNAVLWIAGERLPDGLRLDLPAGQRNSPPAVTSALPTTPAWFHVPGDAVILHALVPRSTGAMLFAKVLSRALFTDLRQRGGYSYTAQADYQVLDRDLAAVVAVADSAPNQREALVGAFVDVLARLRLGTISHDELERAKSAARHLLDGVDTSELLPGQAANLLIDHRTPTSEELRSEVDAVTVADLRAVAQQVHASTLIQAPTPSLDWAGMTAAPMWSDSVVLGREYPPLTESSGTLVIGTQGVSLRLGEQAATVRYSDCVAVQEYPDGGRRLFGRDGFSVAVEPTLHNLDQSVIDAVAHAVPPSLVIPMPPRDPSQIPRPQDSGDQPEHTSRSNGAQEAHARSDRWTTVRTIAFTIMGLVAAFLLFVVITVTGEAWRGDDPDATAGVAVVLWIFFAIPAWLTWKLRPRRRRGA